jgi:hypothetical protein
VDKRSKPIYAVPEMLKGSQPTDGGHLLMNQTEKDALIAIEPEADNWIRPFLGADEFINNIPRYCLWLEGITQEQLNSMPLVQARVAQVKAMRLASTSLSTQKSAAIPYVFQMNRQPSSNYLIIPRVTSENRHYIPIGYVTQNIINSDANFSMENATFYHFAVLNSTMHNAWMRAVCGRLESRYRYSNTIVYNNFPWPQGVSKEDIKKIETAGQAILNARAKHSGKSLAWLYNPETMPANLQDAHDALDNLIDDAYAYSGEHRDAPRVSFLFEQYQKLTSLLPTEADNEGDKVVKSKQGRKNKA